MRKNCPYWEFRSYSGRHFSHIFAHSDGIRRDTSAFSRIWTEYGEIRSISPYSVRMQENAGKMRTRTTPNTDTFYVVFMIKKCCFFNWIYFKFELHYLRCVKSKSLLLKFTMGLVTKSIGFLQVLKIVSIFSLKNGLTSDNIYYI